MPETTFRVEIQKENLVFSAAHFITFGENICERIHGHNYGVRCIVEGSLNEHGYVVDFVALQNHLATITKDLDHRVLLPTKHPAIAVAKNENEVIAKFEDRRWVFPQDDCLMLPIANTTAELLADYIADELLESIDDWGHGGLTKLIVGVDENNNQWGEVEKRLPT